MLKFQNFGPPASPAFRPRFLWLFHSQHFLDLLSHFWKGMTSLTYHKTLGGDRLGRYPLFGVRAGPSGPWGPNHLPKNYLLGVRLTMIISPQFAQGLKSYFKLPQGYPQTDRQTDILNHPGPLKEIFFLKLIYPWGDGKLWICKISIHEALFAHFTFEGLLGPWCPRQESW